MASFLVRHFVRGIMIGQEEEFSPDMSRKIDMDLDWVDEEENEFIEYINKRLSGVAIMHVELYDEETAHMMLTRLVPWEQVYQEILIKVSLDELLDLSSTYAMINGVDNFIRSVADVPKKDDDIEEEEDDYDDEPIFVSKRPIIENDLDESDDDQYWGHIYVDTGVDDLSKYFDIIKLVSRNNSIRLRTIIVDNDTYKIGERLFTFHDIPTAEVMSLHGFRFVVNQKIKRSYELSDISIVCKS